MSCYGVGSGVFGLLRGFLVASERVLRGYVLTTNALAVSFCARQIDEDVLQREWLQRLYLRKNRCDDVKTLIP